MNWEKLITGWLVSFVIMAALMVMFDLNPIVAGLLGGLIGGMIMPSPWEDKFN